ncbi:MAG: recombination protein RecR [Patiriisocius sp.]|jgi:recombination protein RecR
MESSKLISKAVDQFASLPGIGRKTALRLVLHMLKRSNQEVDDFSNAFQKLKENIKYCAKCKNLSDSELCTICANTRRDQSTICIVEDIRDVMAIESTQQFSGLYHVLGGIISPMDGIGPNDLNITSLIQRVEGGEIKEIILALSATMEGDTTNFYIYRKLRNFELNVSSIARGVGVGEELEYTDEVTLGRSILNRTPFEVSVQ